MITKHEALLHYYADVYKRQPSLFLRKCSMANQMGIRIGCPQLCEPHNHVRAVWLLPYERHHIYFATHRKMPPTYIPVQAGSRCPFHADNACTLGDHMPISCRMYPAFFYQEIPDHVDIYLNRCALSSLQPNLVQPHIDMWLAVMVGLMPHLAQRWWDAIASVPRGELLGRAGIDFGKESVLKADETIPIDLCREMHDPFCKLHCDQGVLTVDSEPTACACVQTRMKELEVHTKGS